MDYSMDDQDIQSANLTLYPGDILMADHSGFVAKALPQAADTDVRCHIHTIPSELRSLVFKFLIENVDLETAIQAFNDLLSCAQTCGSWRSILLQSPSLWAELAVFSLQGMCGDFITTFGLANNAPLALDAIIPLPSQFIMQFMGPVAGRPARNDSVTITEAVIRGLQHPGGLHRISIASNELRQLFPAMQKPAPGLTSLRFQCTTNRFLSSDVPAVPRELFARATPNLRHLHLEEIKYSWYSPLVKNLTTLHLSRSFGNVAEQPSLSTVLRTLRTCPQLEVLHVSGCELPRHLGTERPAQIPGMVVALPCLRKLELAGNASDMLALVLNLSIPQALADGISFTCGPDSSRQMALDIFTYANDKHPGSSHDGSDRFGSLDFVMGSELQFRLLRGNVEITVFASSYAVDPVVVATEVLDLLTLGSVTELYVQCDPLSLRTISQSLWQLLLSRLRAVEWMVAPAQTTKQLVSVLTLPQPQALVPALRTLVLEWSLKADQRGFGKATYTQPKEVGVLVDRCIASRKDVDGVEELEVQIQNDVEEGGDEDLIFDEYLYQFVSEMTRRQFGVA
ncbi:hypothetical protein FB451DRAFT_1173936 [Mycena latifolia]|nr:hypothetical protein FB451DRAFT_1173936 [Mycena latifolia]